MFLRICKTVFLSQLTLFTLRIIINYLTWQKLKFYVESTNNENYKQMCTQVQNYENFTGSFP